MAIRFEWDPEKAKTNSKKHGVSFQEATTVFADTLSATIYDPLHSFEEDRYITIGSSFKEKTLVVVHTDRGDNIRLISARLATKKERRKYEEG